MTKVIKLSEVEHLLSHLCELSDEVRRRAKNETKKNSLFLEGEGLGLTNAILLLDNLAREKSEEVPLPKEGE